MSESWKVLGIEPTSDKRAIRAAYSALAKKCHPEEDPQGFQLLHKAYQDAMAYAAIGCGRAESAQKEEPLVMKRGVRETEDAGEEKPPGVGETEDADREKPQESQPDSGDASREEQAPSLLDRLAQADEEELSASMRSGALMQFSAILHDPKKFRKADAWKTFFLSEDFLREQYRESFADGMLHILEGFSTEDHYSMTQMPSGFLLELAIAYGLVLDSRQSEERAAGFYAREVAASIWNMQQTQYSLPVGQLGKPENEVRRRSFADYIRLRDYHRRGLLTRQKEGEWKEFVHGGVVNFLYELKGKGRHEIYPGSRSTCLLDLCAFWIRETEDVPECVLEFIYKDYGLRDSERSSTRRLYEPLKQAILARYPNIEEALYGEDGRAKLVSDWYRDMMQIISDNERYHEEIEGTKERVQELFAGKEWEKIRYLPELFQKVELGIFGRSAIPVSLAKRLMEYFSDEAGVQKQAWEKESGEVMTEEMIHSLYYSRCIRDMHGSVPEAMPYFEEDFWHYFLLRGFGCRSARIDGRRKFRRSYMAGMNASLPAYIEYLYQPSTRWQKLFKKNSLGSGKSMPEFCRVFTDEDGECVPGVEFALPDGKQFGARFYVHYVRYFLDGTELFGPAYDFAEYEALAKSISRAEELLFLLAVTGIPVEDCERAQELIEGLLVQLPLAPVSIPIIARLLAAGAEDEAVGEEEGNRLLGVFYVEDEELCLRAVVRESGFSISRQAEFGWEELHSVAFDRMGGEAAPLPEEKRRAAQEFLRGMKRPAPRLRAALSLEGLTDVEKAERILEALKQDSLYRGYGGSLSECYCVLRFGEDDTQVKKDHVFYASMKPFDFSLALRALEWPSSYEHREEELHRKVKEKHWVVGHFGWGDQSGPEGEELPRIVALGESGTYYYYDVIRLMREENLAALLARMFHFSKVVAVESYEGELSISRFNGELEYCYGREAFLQSAYAEENTAADLFTVFTKAELMREFVVYMDGLLGEIVDLPEDVYFEFSREGCAYAMRFFGQDGGQQAPSCGEPVGGEVVDGEAAENLGQEKKPLVWKIWQQGVDGAEMSRDFKDAAYWYMECGRLGQKLARCKTITAGFDLGGGQELAVRLAHGEEEELEWHRSNLLGQGWE